MLFAYNKERVKVSPEPKTTGICILCGNDMISKCGTEKVWHWAHKVGSNDCDNWYEPITNWHKEWMDFFSSEETEVMIVKESSNEKHVIDIKTKSGQKIDLQSKRIKNDEIEKRDRFWGGALWIINSEEFYKEGLNFVNNEERSKNYVEIIEGWNYPNSIVHEIKRRVLESDERIKESSNYESRNKNSILKFELNGRNDLIIEELKEKIIKINSEYIFKCENRRTPWIYYLNKGVENFGMYLTDHKGKIIGKEFSDIEIYFDKVKGLEGFLFDLKNSKIISKEEFILKIK